MRRFLALINRERIEHRGAFVIAPTVFLVLFAIIFSFALFSGRLDVLFVELARETDMQGAAGEIAVRSVSLAFLAVNAVPIIERGVMILALGWALYVVGVVFFYAADAFWADRRNNAMLFWKSMPIADFTMLMAKFVTAVIVLPLVGVLAMVLNGLVFMILFGAAVLAFTTPALIVSEWLPQFAAVAGGLFVTMLAAGLWYLPFVAWVGALGVVVGRWAIPLSLLIPATLALIENMFVELQFDGGLVWTWLSGRAQFPKLEEGYLGQFFTTIRPFDLGAYLADLNTRLDWPQIGYGLGFALVVLWLASEYRRRYVIT